MSQSALAIELGLSDEELDSIPLEPQDLDLDEGSSGETPTEYYFYVPDSTPEEILEKKGWEIGERIGVSLNIFDEDDGLDR
jgi:hypothetical protein